MIEKSKCLSATTLIECSRRSFLKTSVALAGTTPLIAVNHKTGGLKFTSHYTPVGNPSIIVFLDLAKVYWSHVIRK